MKKRVVLVFALCVILVAAVGCGGSGSGSSTADPIVGTWKIKGAEVAGQEYSVDELNEMASQLGDMSAMFEMQIKFEAGGKGEMIMEGLEDTDASFEWSVEGSDYTLTSEGQDMPITYNADAKTFSLEQSGVVLIFEKI